MNNTFIFFFIFFITLPLWATTQSERYASMHKHFATKEELDPQVIIGVLVAVVTVFIINAIFHHVHISKVKQHDKSMFDQHKESLRQLKK